MKKFDVKTNKKEIEKAIKIIEKFKEHDNFGEINVSYTGKHEKYYERYLDESNKYNRRYVSKNDKQIKPLATKKYFKKLTPVITKELKALERIEKDYHPEDKYNVYEDLGELKEFVTPLFEPKAQKEKDEIERKVKLWEQQNKAGESYHENGRIYEMADGSSVRSKSEWMISTVLKENERYLSFCYEPDLYIAGQGRVRPDFEIISRKTGNIYYWEHVGMLGIEEYASSFVEKMNKYMRGGYFPGKNLILTFESGTKSLDMAVVRQIVKEYFIEI